MIGALAPKWLRRRMSHNTGGQLSREIQATNHSTRGIPKKKIPDIILQLLTAKNQYKFVVHIINY